MSDQVPTDPSDQAPPDLPGAVTSAILPADDPVPNDLSEDEDDIIPRKRPLGDLVNTKIDEDEGSNMGNDDDLFGDGGDDDEQEQAAPEPLRTLEDEELDSGDDEGRHDRMPSEQYDQETQNVVIQESSMSRQPLPEPTDGEMYLTKIPKFLSVEPRRWHHTTYQPPTTDHHSHEAAPGFSAYNTAISTVHWRRSPSNPKNIQSNARILRWSDGSLTLQLASNPTQQYEIEGNPLAPRQRNPAKPTPTSQKPGRKDHSNDSYTYLTVPDPSNGLLRVTHKITAGLSILPSAATTDDALEKLQNSLAAISQGKNKSSAGGIEFVKIDEDPELAKKKAEVAEREKDRARKRREAAETRERERNGRALGRAGLGSRGYGGGLTAGMLEDDELGGGGRQRARAKPARRQRRNSEYSEDEDFGRKKSNFGNDEYDEEDDFIAGSDEEEAVEDDEDEDDGIVEERRPKERAPKRASPDEDDEDAEGEDDDIPQATRTKRRRVIDEDDDDE
ncbi:hypothetical protein KCU95_g18546, partial [Aureobasidium melanogenum]